MLRYLNEYLYKHKFIVESYIVDNIMEDNYEIAKMIADVINFLQNKKKGKDILSKEKIIE